MKARKQWKRCSKCQTEKPIDEFHRDKNRADGLACWCKDCVKRYSSSLRGKQTHMRAKKKNQKKHGKKYRLRHNYSITPGEHESMYARQNGCCGICGQQVKYEDVQTDHDHATGKVRGLLCHRCNLMVGYVENTPELVSPILRWIGGNSGVIQT